MKKELYKYLACYQGITSLDRGIGICPDPDYIMPDSELDRVIREIFSVDSRTGLPMGDLAYYLSPDGNPAVKQWLENNLLKPRGARGQNPEELTDDLLVEFSRGADESLDEYQSRLMGYYDSALIQLQNAKEVEI